MFWRSPKLSRLTSPSHHVRHLDSSSRRPPTNFELASVGPIIFDFGSVLSSAWSSLPWLQIRVCGLVDSFFCFLWTYFLIFPFRYPWLLLWVFLQLGSLCVCVYLFGNDLRLSHRHHLVQSLGHASGQSRSRNFSRTRDVPVHGRCRDVWSI
jgi:hypothetical protein